MNKETGELQTQADQIIDAIIEMDLGSDEESVSSSKKSVSFSAKQTKSAVKSTVASEEVSSFGSTTFKRLIEEPTAIDVDDNQSLSEASNSSEATTVTSNKSKADSRTSSLTSETLKTMKADGMAQGMQKLIEFLNEQRELDKKEAAANRAADINLARRLWQTNKEELQCQRDRDKQEFLEFQSRVLTQESPQRSTHQPTDASARRFLHSSGKTTSW